MRSTSQDAFYLDLAREQAAASDCARRQVGALLVRDDAVLVSAANGTPEGCIPCNNGGCVRCSSNVLSGEAYDACICIHAEQRAIALAASSGASTAGATMYVTLRPCLPCLNLCLHAGIVAVVYDEDIAFDRSVEHAYAQFLEHARISLRRIGGPGA